MPFNYSLPHDRIAQRPCSPADAAKMLVINRQQGTLSDSNFSSLAGFLKSGDLLIFNDSRVIPARLLGRKSETEVELLLLERLSPATWLAIGRPLKRLKERSEITFSADLKAIVTAKPRPDRIEVTFYSKGLPASSEETLSHGLMPIPPYIRNGLSDAQDLTDYQTIFARNEGSIAAPTASLHFTQSLFSKILDKGVEIDYLTLHVGLSSIKEVEPGKAPESEKFYISAELKDKILKYKKQGRRIIAVGTTAVRALESMDLEGQTSLFIQPGYNFKVIDCMITNFHMPLSTHLQLVEAFIGSEGLMVKTYQHALDSDYRFFSYGDGMLIL